MSFNLNDWYSFDVQLNHYLAFDQNDQVSPYSYLKDFLDNHPFIKSQTYIGTGHDRIIKTEQVISDVIRIVAEAQL